MKVRQLSTVHAVGDTRVLHKECKSLLAAGYDVALIASHPYDEVVETVPVLGIGTAPNRLWRMTVSAARLLRRALAEDADIYHFHDPELIGVGLLLRLRGKKVVYDVHEDVPKQIMNKFWIAEPFKRPLALAATLAEKAAAAGLSGVVTATPSIAEKFPPGKTVVVQNFPEADLADEVSDTPFPKRRNAFVYVGGLSEQQRLKAVLDVFYSKLARRGVDLKAVDPGSPKQFGKRWRQVCSLQQGISQENAKVITRLVRDQGPKGVKTQIQGDELRVSSKSRDDLQAVQALIRKADYDFAVQFVNYR